MRCKRSLTMQEREEIRKIPDGASGKYKYDMIRKNDLEESRQSRSKNIRLVFDVFVGFLHVVLWIVLGFAAVGGLSYFINEVM